jgi:heat shock protein HslJ
MKHSQTFQQPMNVANKAAVRSPQRGNSSLNSLLMRILILLVIQLILPACSLVAAGGTTPTPEPTVSPIEPTTPPDAKISLAGTEWRLVSLGAPGAETPVIEGSIITLAFAAGGQATGSGGCNSYGGGYQVQDSTLSFNQINSTLMACANERVTQQERQYFQALQSAGRFELVGNRLRIWYDEGRSALNFAPADSATPAPTVAPPTPVPTTSLISTPTTPSTTPPPITATPGDESSAENPTRIVFAPGESNAEVKATLAERETDFYVLQAQAGQVMAVEITSPHNDVLLSVVGEDGTPFKRYQNGPPAWTRQLPATQDYFIHAVAVGPATSYMLRVSVQPSGSDRAERVEFAPGATLAERGGLLPSGPGITQYVLAAKEGQTMTVDVTSDGTPLSLTIETPSGNRRIAEMRPTADGYAIGHQFALPETGDYLVTLGKADHTPSTNYTATFTIQ